MSSRQQVRFDSPQVKIIYEMVHYPYVRLETQEFSVSMDCHSKDTLEFDLDTHRFVLEYHAFLDEFCFLDIRLERCRRIPEDPFGCLRFRVCKPPDVDCIPRVELFISFDGSSLIARSLSNSVCALSSLFCAINIVISFLGTGSSS